MALQTDQVTLLSLLLLLLLFNERNVCYMVIKLIFLYSFCQAQAAYIIAVFIRGCAVFLTNFLFRVLIDLSLHINQHSLTAR